MPSPTRPVPRRRRPRILALMSLVAASAALFGLWAALTARPPTLVSGVVTRQGQPLKAGVILFEPAGGPGPKFSAAVVDGRYAIDPEKPAGTYAVGIRDDGGAVDAKYNLPSTSGLSVEIRDDRTNSIDFELR